MLPENNRREDFFEADEYQAVLDNLPEYLRPAIQTAYITGWRINSEILTREKRHVDLDSGCLRFEPGEANDEKGRSFPLTGELRKVLTRQLEKTAELEQKAGRIIPWLFHRDGKPKKIFGRPGRLRASEQTWWGKFRTISGARPSEILNVRECHIPQR